jgi:hypothetical protein
MRTYIMKDLIEVHQKLSPMPPGVLLSHKHQSASTMVLKKMFDSVRSGIALEEPICTRSGQEQRL